LSWPIILDKSIIAFSYVWLSKMIAKLGTLSITSYNTVKNLEHLGYLPVMASAAVITFLVSNSLGAKDVEGAIANIKKVLILSLVTTIPLFFILCSKPHICVRIFDLKNEFSDLAAAVLPMISILSIFDLLQIALAAALRGAGDTKTVMYGRAAACGLFFFPVSWFLSNLPIKNTALKFILIYGSFYVATGIICCIFLKRFTSNKWYSRKI